MRTRVYLLLGMVLLGLACGSCGGGIPDPSDYRRGEPSEYFIYAPVDGTAGRRWPVFVGIHGFGGSGRDCWSMWQPYADEYGFVLVCPSLADHRGGWYQATGEAYLVQILDQVFREYSVRPGAFLAGFSAGAQFVQGFAFAYPRYVSGVSVISAGNYYTPNAQAAGIPFVVIIGERDDAVSVQGARTFAANLQAYGYSSELHVLPEVGHGVPQEAKELTLDFFEPIYER